ncbi:MAG: hypothetical protein OXK78_07570 [Caldilineaceae bacterium]|nr:hypothetical protein [Caldilineaceae bacterium]
MVPRKRFSMAAGVIMAVLFTIVLASLAAAQQQKPPPPKPPQRTPTPTPTRVPLQLPTSVSAVTPDPTKPPPPPGVILVTGVKELVYPWPPPNAIVLHPATPIQLSAAATGLRCYFIGRDGDTRIGPYIDSFDILAQMHSGDAVSLYSGQNPLTGKPVTIQYLPANRKLRVSTFYADRPPHDFDKPYVFTVDANHSITHEQW